jgi:alkanesulfonate monooxygenase SsuD/methylene tetrahydromethanopterin reductase-like flavin-dependent oxidoreductase (luciferase family)
LCVSKKIGFLSFGAWAPSRGSSTQTAQDALLQSIDLAVAAEELGVDGAFFRVHHFAHQNSVSFPLLAAIAARTKRIEIGTGVIDMRYENPLYMAEEAAATDLISGGRLQLGVSRGSPETALNGSEAFGFVPPEGMTDADVARAHTEHFLAAIQGAGVALSNPQMTGASRPVAIEPQSPGLSERIWWGSGTRATATWTAEQGMNLMSSTLLTEDTGVPFGDLQAEQIALFREAWAKAGWDREPRVSVSRSIMPITTDLDRAYFGGRAEDHKDQVGYLDASTIARFGRSYTGEPDAIVRDLLDDAAVREADTILLTVPTQLGVDYNAHLLETVMTEIAPALGWKSGAVKA